MSGGALHRYAVERQTAAADRALEAVDDGTERRQLCAASIT
ncbi:hypothetical protein [Bogoriella caseilytica]|nr:hypothetical protein [Bogoriella caseilytica]